MTAIAVAGCGDGREAVSNFADRDPADAEIGRVVDEALPDGASGTLVAARGGDMIHCAGFGMADREAQLRAMCDTVYDVMSMTKQFTAAAILKLEMMGKLELGDTINDHLGPVPADKRGITVHHLLTHTSGLIEALGDDYARQTRASMLTAAFESALQSEPGAEYHYSNLGYSVLAAVIETASGRGYEQFLAEHLFTPAGMSQTGYVLPEWQPDRVAVEYDPRGQPQGRPFEHPWDHDGPYWNLRGNGGLLSTGRDMFRWHVALDGDEILDEQAKRTLFEPHVREEAGGDSHYGYGWVILSTDAGDAAWHNGGNGWSYGEVARLLDARALVFWITNRSRDDDDGWSMEQLAPTLTQGVAELVLAGD